MDASEIFAKLLSLRENIIEGTGEPMLGSDNALLYDVAKALGLSEYQAQILAGDKPVTAPVTEPAVFGIGGIGVFSENEMPIIPSVAAIERMEKLEKTDVICRRCGASQNFDGAMFTTSGTNICDDCF